MTAPFQPHPSALTRPFWDATARGRLQLTRCTECRRWQHPPLELCRHCAGPLVAEDAPMHGVVYSSTVTHHPATPLYPVPYQVAVVELGAAGGPRVVVRVADGRAAPGATVRIRIDALPGGDFRVPVATVVDERTER